MGDPLDDDMNEPQVPAEIPVEPQPPVVQAPKPPIGTADSIHAIVPQNFDEAWRFAIAFTKAGMVPDSLAVWRDSSGDLISASAARKNKMAKYDGEATVARVALVIMKGMEVGFGPVTAVQTIMVINNKPCIYGDGVIALIQKSGVVEYMKTDIEGDPNIILPEKANYKVTVTLKRKDQKEPYIRSFSYQDAIKAGIISKTGPWTDYRPRQCYFRAFSWAVRDGAGDALMGLQLAEEVQDYITVQKREAITDTSSLDDGASE